MAVDLFVVKDILSKKPIQFVKASTKGQVAKFRATSVTIEKVSALDFAEFQAEGQIRIDDATAVQAEATGETPAASGQAADETGSEAGTPPASGEAPAVTPQE